jgi:hypothetical protein
LLGKDSSSDPSGRLDLNKRFIPSFITEIKTPAKYIGNAPEPNLKNKYGKINMIESEIFRHIGLLRSFFFYV